MRIADCLLRMRVGQSKFLSLWWLTTGRYSLTVQSLFNACFQGLPRGTGRDLTDAFNRLIGVRAGPGMTRTVREIMGEAPGSARMSDMVYDAREMLINALTVPELRHAFEIDGAPCRFDSDGPGSLFK